MIANKRRLFVLLVVQGTARKGCLCVCVTGATAPQRFLLVADWGLSHNSSVTLQHLLLSAANTTTPPVVLYIADFCYAGQSLPAHIDEFVHDSTPSIPALFPP